MNKFKVILLVLAMASPTANAVKIESNAVISDSIKNSGKEAELINALVGLVRHRGYACSSVSAALPFIFGGGYTLRCNNNRYSYEIRDIGGNWRVFVK